MTFNAIEQLYSAARTMQKLISNFIHIHSLQYFFTNAMRFAQPTKEEVPSNSTNLNQHMQGQSAA